ncbi:MAG: EpsG family protein, partial [Paraprevotella sp.]|nr:EpsG family protein [Paraprevotella sp.]
MCCLLFVLFFGGRGFIGWDWTAYYDIYESFPSVLDSSFFHELIFKTSENQGTMEKGFLVYLALMKSLGFNYFMFVFFSVFIDMILVDRFIQRFCPNYALAMLLFVYVYCNAEINLQRNMKSMALFLYSLQYAEQRKIIPFMALNLLGFTFHFSALFYICSYWLFRIPIGRRMYIALVLFLNVIYFFKINLLGGLISLVAGWVGGKA